MKLKLALAVVLVTLVAVVINVTLAAPSTLAFTITAQAGANVRSGPGMQYGLTGGVARAQTVIVSGRNGAWLFIEAGRWIAASTGTLAGDVNTLPIVAALSVTNNSAPVTGNTVMVNITWVGGSRVRAQPSRTSPGTDSLLQNSVPQVNGRVLAEGQWWLRLANGRGWFSIKYGVGGISEAVLVTIPLTDNSGAVVSIPPTPAAPAPTGGARAISAACQQAMRQSNTTVAETYQCASVFSAQDLWALVSSAEAVKVPRSFTLKNTAYSVAGDCNSIVYGNLLRLEARSVRAGAWGASLNTVRASATRLANIYPQIGGQYIAAQRALNTYGVTDASNNWMFPGGWCQTGEGPLACELRQADPSVMVLGFGTSEIDEAGFGGRLDGLVQTLLGRGTVPILVTTPTDPRGGRNAVIRDVATRNNVPLIDGALLGVRLQAAGLPIFRLNTGGGLDENHINEDFADATTLAILEALRLIFAGQTQ